MAWPTTTAQKLARLTGMGVSVCHGPSEPFATALAASVAASVGAAEGWDELLQPAISKETTRTWPRMPQYYCVVSVSVTCEAVSPLFWYVTPLRTALTPEVSNVEA